MLSIYCTWKKRKWTNLLNWTLILAGGTRKDLFIGPRSVSGGQVLPPPSSRGRSHPRCNLHVVAWQLQSRNAIDRAWSASFVCRLLLRNWIYCTNVRKSLQAKSQGEIEQILLSVESCSDSPGGSQNWNKLKSRQVLGHCWIPGAERMWWPRYLYGASLGGPDRLHKFVVWGSDVWSVLRIGTCETALAWELGINTMI